MTTPFPIKLATALPTDLYAVAALESRVFFNEPFSIVAFGPDRDSEANKQGRATSLGKPPKKRGERTRIVKATLGDEIIGSGVFYFVTGRRSGGDELMEKEEGKGGKSEAEEGGSGWGKGANVRFCEDVIVKGDGHMMQSCEGADYAKLGSLVVSEDYQRRGIGTQILELFLEEADSLGLQAVLGASKQGRDLYRRYGFRDIHIAELKLWEYEGGEGLGTDEHVIMHRPAKTQ